MEDTFKSKFQSLANNVEFQLHVEEFRGRHGIPRTGFDPNSQEYSTWVKEAVRREARIKEDFDFIVKRCKDLFSWQDPIFPIILSIYMVFNAIPQTLPTLDKFFRVKSSGLLGYVDFIFSVPFLFAKDAVEALIKEKGEQINEVSASLAEKTSALPPIGFNPQKMHGDDKEFLPVTPGNGADIIDQTQRNIGYLVTFGRVVLRERLQRLKPEDFVISKYEDKNKHMDGPIGQMGTFLFNRGLFKIAEDFWANIDAEIQEYNKQNGKSLNRGIALANLGVAQVVEGKVTEGLFNLYKAHDNDKQSLSHLNGLQLDPEQNLVNSILYTQFEERVINWLYNDILNKHASIFALLPQESEVKQFILSLTSDKKIFLFLVLCKFKEAYFQNTEVKNFISRGEILRSLADLAAWYEDGLRRKDHTVTTLVPALAQHFGQINPTKGEYSSATTLDELIAKIDLAVALPGDLLLSNARVMSLIRNFSGHNFDSQDHDLFTRSDEVVARMFSIILESNKRSLI